jgi:hypothetical protein
MRLRRATKQRAAEGEVERLPEARKALARVYIGEDRALTRRIEGEAEVVAARRMRKTDGADDRSSDQLPPERPPPAAESTTPAAEETDRLPIHRWFDDL